MTRTELERLTAVEEQVRNIDGKLDDLKKDLCDFIAAADNKYASKLTERIVYGLVALTMIAVFSALLALIIVKG